MAEISFVKRHWAYAIGVCLLPVATIVYTIGLVCPYWSITYEGRVEVVSGLWTRCQPGSSLLLTNCHNRVSDAESWLRGVQFMQLMGAILLIVACFVALHFNIKARAHYHPTVEFLGAFGGLFGVFSALLYLASTGIPFSPAFPVTFSWGFALGMAGGLLAIVGVILIAATNTPRDLPRERARKQQESARRRARARNWLPFYRPRKTVVDDGVVLVPPVYVVSHV